MMKACVHVSVSRARLPAEVVLQCANDNSFSVPDHDILSDAERLRVPMRVLANDEGSELVFSLCRLSGMSDEDFQADEGMVRQDLAALKGLLQSQARAWSARWILHAAPSNVRIISALALMRSP